MPQTCNKVNSSDNEGTLVEQGKINCCGKIVAIFICTKCFHVMSDRNTEHYVDCYNDNSGNEKGKFKQIMEFIKQQGSNFYSEQFQNEPKMSLTHITIPNEDSTKGMNQYSLKPVTDFEELSSVHNRQEDKKFDENKGIEKENILESSKKPFKNPICSNINREKVKPKCMICSKSFSRKSTLAIHERIHRGEKPYQCQFCSKRFTCDTTLLRHERIHTGERPFQCKFCSKSFTQSVNLKSHEALHTVEKHKGERPFNCPVCSKSYAHRSSLILHKRLHKEEKPFICTCCSKSFAIRSSLTLHERIHTGEKPYSCKFCSKSFSDRSSMVKHERIHTGEKPFLCQFCSRSFTDRTTFVRHERIHKRDK